ncbi:alpha/beta fold hydrolase [Flavobacterium soyae]|uniref:alpha/beta fold hydrolase n=1 Tax=Flavobacterium soyae TaxID=2903098 RepID=UPI001E491412|nr:alpha/beta fold hydrolase [Flavobacterium soyae]MCD9574053.1 alpha/beta fold hydrolase [Flavobacterium soyae]
MRIKSTIKKLFICIIFFHFFSDINAQNSNNTYKLKTAASYFPDWKEVNSQNIKWYSLSVPENWESSNSNKTIKLAVAVLPCFKKSSKNAVHISGGPGGWCIGPIKKWLNHPLRNEANIILVDLRGTGFSEPSLCPKLGKDILQVLAENNSTTTDINQIVNVSEQCKNDLIEKGIDIKAYNSLNISKDLHALKESLGINKWFVYGVSYGTYITQVYSGQFPNDFEGIILDSPINNIHEYYKNNTSNYISSLNTLFKESKQKFPDLESKYYSVINKLNKKGIEVNVDKTIVQTGKFTYNADDFKIIIHQSLYNKQLIELVPLIINSFYKEDKFILANLVDAFSEALKRDFGTYYCVSCNDGFTDKSIADYDQNTAAFKKNKRGILFYRSDLSICEKWEIGAQKINDSTQKNNQIKTLIFAGKYDPITPLNNGKELAKKYKKSFLFEMPYGHATSFSKAGKSIVESFISRPDKKPEIKEELSQIKFISNIKYNGGISKLAKSLNKPVLLYISPLIIAIIVVLGTFLYCIFSIFRGKNKNLKVLKYLFIVNSSLGMVIVFGFIWAVFQTSNYNLFILLFGLPEKYNFLFILNYIFIGTTIINLLYLLVRIKLIPNLEVVFSTAFSYILIIIYLFHWGIV